MLVRKAFYLIWGFTIWSVMSSFLCLTPVKAQSLAPTSQSRTWAGGEWTLEAYSGMLTGQLQEYVLIQPGNKSVSRLDWRLSAPIVGGTLSFRAHDRVTIQFGGYTNITSGRNNMDDFDWLTVGSNLDERAFSNRPEWSDWSTHPDTRLNYARMFDVNVHYEFLQRENDKGLANAYLIGGFRNTLFSLSGMGGSSIMSWDGFRVNHDTFKSDAGIIDYAQNYYLPYIGLGSTWRYGRFSLGAEIIGTLYGFGYERDNHILRSIEFRSHYTNIPFIGGKLSVDYRLDGRYSLFAHVDYQHMFFSTADVLMNEYGKGTRSVNEDNGGLNAQTMVVGFGLKARLY